MDSASACRRLMVVKYWLLAAKKDVINSLFLTRVVWNSINLLAIRNTFEVYERLKREQHIDTLFRNGKAFSVFPVRILYLLIPREPDARSPVLAGFSVPKKKFPLSVDRHRIRRLMVESWRLSKASVYTLVPTDKQVHLFFVYTDRKLPDYRTVYSAIAKGTEMLSQYFSEKEPKENPKNLNAPE